MSDGNGIHFSDVAVVARFAFLWRWRSSMFNRSKTPSKLRVRATGNVLLGVVAARWQRWPGRECTWLFV